MAEPEHKDRWSFDQITESIYLGADLCCGGDHYDYLCDVLGISADIEVKVEGIELTNPKIKERLRLAVVDNAAPEQLQLDVGVGMIAAVVEAGEKVYVHCRLGHGRSPTLVAAYFVSTGMGVDEAMAKIRGKRSVIHPTEVQVEALREYHGKRR